MSKTQPRNINAGAYCKVRTGMGYLVFKNPQVIKFCVLVGERATVLPVLFSGERPVSLTYSFFPGRDNKRSYSSEF